MSEREVASERALVYLLIVRRQFVCPFEVRHCNFLLGRRARHEEGEGEGVQLSALFRPSLLLLALPQITELPFSLLDRRPRTAQPRAAASEREGEREGAYPVVNVSAPFGPLLLSSSLSLPPLLPSSPPLLLQHLSRRRRRHKKLHARTISGGGGGSVFAALFPRSRPPPPSSRRALAVACTLKRERTVNR